MNNPKTRLCSFVRSNKLLIVHFFALFALLAALIALVPLSGDDWAWGSQIGIDRLTSWFRGYNGRYSGNLFVLTLTRSAVLRSIFTSFVLTLICFVPLFLAKKKSYTLLLFSTALLLSIPKPILVQGFLWTAGFSNYVPPILFFFIYMITVNDNFEKEHTQYTIKRNIAYSVIAFAISLISAMFLENVTIFIVFVAILSIGYYYIRFKRLCIPHLFFLLGGGLGAFFMFSNSVYSDLQEQSDGYRGMPGQLDSVFDTFVEQTSDAAVSIFANGFILTIALCALCTVLALSYKRTCESRTLRKAATALFVINIAFGALFVLRRIDPLWDLLFGWLGTGTAYGIVMIAIMLVFCVSVIALSIICVKDTPLLHRLLLIAISAAVLLAPMLIIKPYGPRVLAPTYICLIMFTALLFEYVASTVSLGKRARVAIASASLLISLTSIIFYSVVYSNMKAVEIKRDEYISKQLEQGYTEITVCNLPYLSYLQCGDLKANLWQTRYKKFHGIDTSVKFKIVSSEEFDKWIEEFEGREK